MPPEKRPDTGVELPGRLELVVNALFPSIQLLSQGSNLNAGVGEFVPSFTDEIIAAVKSLPNH